MSEKTVQVKVILTPELKAKFDKVREITGIMSSADVLRYCISREYARIVLKQNFSDPHSPK